MQKLLVVTAIAWSLAGTREGVGSSVAAPIDIQARVDAYLAPFVHDRNFSGTVLIARKGAVPVSKGYGMANYELGVPNTAATRFHIASVSKPFTAAAILILQQEGRLKTTDPVSRFVDGFPGGDGITLEHLLTHTSGIPNVNDFPDYDQESRRPHTPADLITLFKDRPRDFPPGDRYAYSNSNYNVLAYVIEKVSGQEYGTFLRESIFRPLGMDSTGHDGRAGALVPDRAAGYAPSGARELENAPYLDWSVKTGNGSLYSTVADLYRFDRSLYGDALLSKESRATMFAGGPGNRYGWFVRKRGERNVAAANGRSPGFTASFERFVDDDVCVIVLANTYATVSQDPIAGDLAAIAFDEERKPPAVTARAVDPAVLDGYAGSYTFGPDFFRPNATVAIRREGDHLVMDWGRGYLSLLVPVAEDEFLDRTFWARVILRRDAHGARTRGVYRSDKDYVMTMAKSPPGAKIP